MLIAWHTGDHERALQLAEEVRAELDEHAVSTPMLGHLRGVILAATALVSALAGNVEQATADLLTAYPAALETEDQPIVAAAGTAVAGWLMARGRSADAARVLGAAAVVRGADDPTDRAIATIGERLRNELGAPVSGPVRGRPHPGPGRGAATPRPGGIPLKAVRSPIESALTQLIRPTKR